MTLSEIMKVCEKTVNEIIDENPELIREYKDCREKLKRTPEGRIVLKFIKEQHTLSFDHVPRP